MHCGTATELVLLVFITVILLSNTLDSGTYRKAHSLKVNR